MLIDRDCNHCLEVECVIIDKFNEEELIESNVFVFDTREGLINHLNSIENYNSDECSIKKQFNYK